MRFELAFVVLVFAGPALGTIALAENDASRSRTDEVGVSVPVEAPGLRARIKANRTSGIAPVAVLFDGAALSDCDGDGVRGSWDDDYIGCHYEWDFGGAAAGTWIHSGFDKDTHKGPMAAMVFPGDGPYTVTLTMRRGDGSVVDTATVDVDPALPASSTGTCISRDADLTGCPSGYEEVPKATGDFQTIVSKRIAAGKRDILLKGGQTWQATARLVITQAGPGRIGSFGRGKATITSVGSAFGPAMIVLDAADWRIEDLSLRGGPSFLRGNASADRTLIHRVDTLCSTASTGAPSGTATSFAVDTRRKSSISLPEEVVFFDSRILADAACPDHSGPYNWWGLKDSALIGSEFVMTPPGSGEHAVRMHYHDHVVIAHSRIAGADRRKHALKIHNNLVTKKVALDVGPYLTPCWLELGRPPKYPVPTVVDGTSRQAQCPTAAYLFVSWSRFDDNDSGSRVNWLAAIRPQNTRTDEPTRFSLWEGNWFENSAACSSNCQLINVGSQDVVLRSNLFDIDVHGDVATVGVFVTHQNTLSSERVKVLGNTCATEVNRSNGVSCASFESGSSHEARNNLLHHEDATSPRVVTGSGVEQSGNVSETKNPFQGTRPYERRGDFEPASPNPHVIDAAPAEPRLFYDNKGVVRSKPDVGAVEYTP